MQQSIQRPRAVGIIYGADGAPKISPEWVQALHPDHREWVNNDMAEHGYRLNAAGMAEKV